MLFNIERTSDPWLKDPGIAEVNDIATLLAIIETEKRPIVITKNHCDHGDGDCDYTIEIYDDYRE